MNIERPIQILVRRRAALGDIIMSTGVVRELKQRYNCEIDIATEYFEIFDNNPHVRQLYHTERMPDINNYDIYINLDDAYEYNPVNHYVDSYFYRAFGSTDFNKSPELFPNDNDQQVIDQFITTNSLERYIVIHMRQWHWPLKNMAELTWYEVFEKLFTNRADFKIVCVGSDSDGYVDHPLFVDSRGRLTIQQQKLLMDRARCFVGTDSGPFHIAGCTDTIIIALQTHLLPDRIMPYRSNRLGHRCLPIMSSVDCVGCNDRQTRPVSQVVCDWGDYRCSNSFNSNNIAQTILEII